MVLPLRPLSQEEIDRALAVLEEARRRCATEDARTDQVYAALEQLEAHAAKRWPFDQFRRTLGARDLPFTPDAAGRGQVLNASLNGIRRAIGVLAVLALLCSACGSSTPTAPATPAPTPTPTPAPVPTPTPIGTVQTIDCPSTTTGIELSFYRQIGCNAFDLPLQPVRRWTVAPKVYLRTVDEAGAAIDTLTLDTVQNAMIETAMVWTGNHFGLEGVLRGTDTREGQTGWITVKWPAAAEAFCGLSDVGRDGGTIAFGYKTPGCGCNGSAIRPRTARHELGHAFGYWHTDNTNDLMSNLGVTKPCDQQPSARELQAAAYQYR